MKLNGWKMIAAPKKVYILTNKTGFAAGKKLFKDNNHVGWYPVKDGVGFIGNIKHLQDHLFNDKLFVSFDKNFQVSILHSRLKGFFISKGFIFNKRSDLYYLPKSLDEASVIYSKPSNIYANLGFKYSIERINNDLILVINPYQVITKDGNFYSAKYSQKNNHITLSDPILKPNYSKLVKCYNYITNLLSSNFKMNITCYSSGDLIFQENNKVSFVTIKEPNLFFGSGKFNNWPKLGLSQFGPLDANIGKADRPSIINVAFVGSRDSFNLLSELKSGGKRKQYGYKGFDKVFRSQLIMGKERFSLINSGELESISNVNEIAELLISKIVEIINKGVLVDIALIELPNEWERFYINQESDLHDLIKINAWQHKISTQLFLKSDFESTDNTDLLHNLGLGIYYKSKGEPWRVETKHINCAYVGISFGYSISESKKLIGVAEVFDCYGQFVALRSMTIKEKSLDKNFDSKRDLHLLPNQLSDLISKLLHDYYTFMGNIYPDNLIIHKTTYFNKNEQADIEQLTSIPTSISLVYTQSKSNWHIIGDKVPIRGTMQKLSNRKAILYTSGIMQGQNKYFLPGAPKPYLVDLQTESNYSITDISEQIMELSKLNYNSTNTYSKYPITLLHSKKIVNLLRAGLSPNAIPTDPRYFL